jgi:hypothetical protein
MQRPVQTRRWVGVILPILALRALLPAGFMPVLAADGRLTLGFCSGVSMQRQTERHRHHATDASHGAHHEHGDHAPGHEAPGSLAEVTVCPFVAACSAAPVPAAPVLTAIAAITASPAAPVERPHAVPTILRAQSPRAPPPPA